MLTGQPRFAGILRPYMSMGAWLECEWDDSESIWLEYDDGRYELIEARNRLRGRGTYEALSETEAQAFRSDLQGTFLVCPRTRAPGDPAWAEEIEVLCRRPPGSSPLPETTALYRRGGDGRPVWRFEIEFEGVAVFETVPGTALGGFHLIDSDPGEAVIEPYGQATAPSERYTVTYRDVEYTRASALLGPPALVAIRAAEGDEPGTATLHTIDKPD